MKNYVAHFFILAVILLGYRPSFSQVWLVPQTGSAVTPTSKLGVSGTGGLPLQISADNTSQIQFFTGTPSTQKMIISADGRVGIGTSTLSAVLNLAAYDASYIQFSRPCGQYGPCNGSSGIKFAEGGSIYQSSFPAYGTGTLTIDNGNSMIALRASSINFGGLIGIDNIAGKYNFNDLVWANSAIISDYATKSSSLKSMPTGYKFAVNGKSNLIGNVSIGIVDTTATHLLNIASEGGDQFINFVRKTNATQASFTGKSGIILSNGAKISQSSFPNYGTGALDIENGTAKISLYDGAVNFGGIIGAGNTAGKFNFNNLTWATSLVVADFGTPAPGSFKQIPTGYKFAVNGKSNFIDNVVIGNIGSIIPKEIVEIISSGDQIIKLSRNTSSTGTSGIKFSDGASILQSSSSGTVAGLLTIDAKTTSLTSKTIHFGTPPEATSSSYVGNFNFDNLVWAKSLVVSDYGTPVTGSFNQIPTGFKFAVNGKSNFLDNVVVGNITAFTKGIPTSGYKLFVSEGILSEKFKCAIKTTDNWSDFVFAPGYKLMSLDSVGKFINENKHLPGIPTADEVVKNGLDLAKMDATLLQKIEELTLYVIQLKKENELIRKEFLKK